MVSAAITSYRAALPQTLVERTNSFLGSHPLLNIPMREGFDGERYIFEVGVREGVDGVFEHVGTQPSHVGVVTSNNATFNTIYPAIITTRLVMDPGSIDISVGTYYDRVTELL